MFFFSIEDGLGIGFFFKSASMCKNNFIASSIEIGGGVSLSFNEMPYHSAPFLFDDMLLLKAFGAGELIARW